METLHGALRRPKRSLPCGTGAYVTRSRSTTCSLTFTPILFDLYPCPGDSEGRGPRAAGRQTRASTDPPSPRMTTAMAITVTSTIRTAIGCWSTAAPVAAATTPAHHQHDDLRCMSAPGCEEGSPGKWRCPPHHPHTCCTPPGNPQTELRTDTRVTHLRSTRSDGF